MLHIGQQMDST